MAVINGNYALQAGISPTEDAIKIEGKDSPYVNVVVVRDENINDPDVKELVNELQSEKVKKFVDEKYQGSIITTF